MISSGRPTFSGTLANFEFTYGYMEIKAKAPNGQGLWPAFWTLRPDHSWPPEIDTFEILGHEPNKVHMYIHYKNTDGSSGSSGKSFAGPDFSSGFHTFAVDWSPSAVIWYIDGIERSRFSNTQNIPDVPMYLIANLAVGGPESWPGAPDSTTVFPAYYEIDYIRVWKKLSTSLTPTPKTSTTPSSTPGDANFDGLVDSKDYTIWLTNYDKSGSLESLSGDFNKDSKIDGKDYIIWASNFK
jgi:beta-glucanase (GH16 family)